MSIVNQTGKMIPYMIIGFFISLFIIIGTMMFLALRDYPGEITKDAYQKGLKYNTLMEEAEIQKKRGWESKLDFETKDSVVTTRFHLSDKSGAAIPDASVGLWFIRLTQAGNDKEKITMQPDGKGNYTADTTLPLKGEWEVHVSATYHNQNFQQVSYVSVK